MAISSRKEWGSCSARQLVLAQIRRWLVAVCFPTTQYSSPTAALSCYCVLACGVGCFCGTVFVVVTQLSCKVQVAIFMVFLFHWYTWGMPVVSFIVASIIVTVLPGRTRGPRSSGACVTPSGSTSPTFRSTPRLRYDMMHVHETVCQPGVAFLVCLHGPSSERPFVLEVT